jgi:hypothetical protein
MAQPGSSGTQSKNGARHFLKLDFVATSPRTATQG